MKELSFRLRPGHLLKEEIEAHAKKSGTKAGTLLSVVGSLKKAVLRMAGASPENQEIKTWEEDMEIVSGTGTISRDGCHLHVSLSRRDGSVIGGHLKDGCIVNTTAEIVIGILDDVTFSRTQDPDTGFKELSVE